MNNELTDNDVNKIISEFMGDPKQEKVYVNCPSLCSCELCERPDLIYPKSLLGIGTPYYFQNKTIKYTKSLDSLVPVWDKCGILITRLDINNAELQTFHNNPHKPDEFTGVGYTIQQAAAKATAKAILELNEVNYGK